MRHRVAMWILVMATTAAVAAEAAPSHLLIQLTESGYRIGDQPGNTGSSTLFKLPISTVWMDKLVADDVRGPTGMVCRVTLRKDSSNLVFLVWVHRTTDSRYSIYTFGSGTLQVGNEPTPYRNGRATSKSIFREVGDFDFSQQLAFSNATHGRNVEISVKASDDTTLIDKAKAVRVEGKDRKVLVEGAASGGDPVDVGCSIQ